MDKFTLERFKLIIDHLCDNKPALKSCSLVCRAWLQRTRLYLFGTVHIRSAPRCVDLIRLLDNSSTLPTEANLSHFIHTAVFWHFPFSEVDPISLGRSLSRLQKVTQLHICAGSAPDLSEALYEELGTAFPNVRTLSIEKAEFKNPRDILHLLSVFPKLADLQMCDFVAQQLVCQPRLCQSRPATVRGEWTTQLLDGKPAREITLENVDLGGSVYAALAASWLQHSHYHLRLRSLHITWPLDTAKKWVLKGFLQAVDPALNAFRFAVAGTCKQDDGYKRLSSELDGLRMPKLEALDIGPIAMSPKAISSPAHLVWITHLLTRVSSRNLQLIRLTLCVSQMRDLDLLDWAVLDDALLQIAKNIQTAMLLFTVVPEDARIFDTKAHAKEFLALLSTKLRKSRPARLVGGASRTEDGDPIIHVVNVLSCQ